MLRAHLIMNPEARGVTPALQRVVIAALEARFKLDCTETTARDEAIAVARAAVEDGNEFVIAFGGDGLVNEIANGIVNTNTILGIIPGGTMNVFARNLGIPTDHVEATDRIISFTGDSKRNVELASANGRYFTFSCGCGFDAEAAAFVESHKIAKRRYGEAFFYGAAFMTFLRSYFQKDPFLEVRLGERTDPAVMAIALNRGPYAYLFGRRVRLVPDQSTGMDVFALTRMKWWRVPQYALGAMATARYGESVAHSHVDRITISGREPFAVHVDGEPLEPIDHVEIVGSAAQIEVIL